MHPCLHGRGKKRKEKLSNILAGLEQTLCLCVKHNSESQKEKLGKKNNHDSQVGFVADLTQPCHWWLSPPHTLAAVGCCGSTGCLFSGSSFCSLAGPSDKGRMVPLFEFSVLDIFWIAKTNAAQYAHPRPCLHKVQTLSERFLVVLQRGVFYTISDLWLHALRRTFVVCAVTIFTQGHSS